MLFLSFKQSGNETVKKKKREGGREKKRETRNKITWDGFGKTSLVQSSCVCNCTKDVIRLIKSEQAFFLSPS